jgi:hypothetical protein
MPANRCGAAFRCCPLQASSPSPAVRRFSVAKTDKRRDPAIETRRVSGEYRFNVDGPEPLRTAASCVWCDEVRPYTQELLSEIRFEWGGGEKLWHS